MVAQSDLTMLIHYMILFLCALLTLITALIYRRVAQIPTATQNAQVAHELQQSNKANAKGIETAPPAPPAQ